MPTLEFKGKQHIYAHHLTVPHRLLVVDQKRSVYSKGVVDDNLIIHGDNLCALKALLPRFAGRVNCVYIDPPYNTGHEGWVYNDNVNSPLMRDWLCQHGPVDGEDLQRHDKWLCMMWPRLHLLKDLLSEDGVITISIDDNELNHLRTVMDEIFGSENFVACIVWRKKAGGGQDSEYLAREHEYVLCYRKSKSFSMNFRTVKVSEKDFSKTKNGRRCKFSKLEKWGSNALRTDRPSMFYPIIDPDGNDFYPQAPNGEEGNWRTRPTKLDNEHIHWSKNKDRWVPYEVKYFDEVPKIKTKKDRTIFYDIATTTDAACEQKRIFGRKKLDNSKPVDLIRRLLEICTHEDAVVLDSFAGSGTTGHAVLALNRDDGGNRKFILVECEDYADSITAERIRRVIHGTTENESESTPEKLGGSFTYCTMGKVVDVESMLRGKSLPTYSELARFLLFTSLGVSTSTKFENQNEQGLFYRTENTDYYLLYRPDIEWLRSDAAILDDTCAKKIRDVGKCAVVFAADKYIGQRFLTDMGITFCQLPYELQLRG